MYNLETELDSQIEKSAFRLPQSRPSPEQSPDLPKFKAPEPLDSHFEEIADPMFKFFEVDSPTKGRRIPEFVNRGIAGSFKDEPSRPDIKFISPTTYISPKNGDESQFQVPIFRMPDKFAETLSDGHTEQSDISTEPLDDSVLCIDDRIQEIDPPIPKFDQATCPMCGDVVDSEFLRSYNNGNLMNVRMQIKFCRAHKKNSARDTWIFQGYPTIDWESLDERIAKHHHFLQNLLNGASSHYRDALSESVKSGKSRTLKQSMLSSDMPVGPGYYGSRGLRAMSENIMNKFSPQLRKIAVKDRLVASRGVTGYVQAVLVPELATRLIKEDMGVSAKRAREIMSESVGMGDLLNDELQDVVDVRRDGGTDGD
jgi:RTC4-like domain